MPLAGVMVALMFLQYSVNVSVEQLVLPSGPTAGAMPEPQHVFYGTHLALGAALAVLFGAAGFLAQGRSTRPIVPMLWAASAVFVPLAILVALYYRIYKFEQSMPFAGIALLLAALFALATEALSRREPRPGSAAAAAIFATGAVAALALALTMALEKGWLTVALALMVPGVAWIADKRPLPALRILVGVLVAGVLARIAYNPAIVGLTNLGTTPIFNWLLWGYGIPAAAFWLGGHLLRRRADDAPARMADSAALLFAVLLAFLEVRHYMTGGNMFRAVERPQRDRPARECRARDDDRPRMAAPAHPQHHPQCRRADHRGADVGRDRVRARLRRQPDDLAVQCRRQRSST